MNDDQNPNTPRLTPAQQAEMDRVLEQLGFPTHASQEPPKREVDSEMVLQLLASLVDRAGGVVQITQYEANAVAGGQLDFKVVDDGNAMEITHTPAPSPGSES